MAHSRRWVWLSVAVALILSAPQSARSDEIYTFVIKKQEEKAQKRWSLQDWLETRDRMRLQDLWLALHSPSPYEFFIGGDYQFAQITGGQRFQAWETYAAAYASVFGLEARRESQLDTTRWTGLFNFRFFGYHAQGTQMTLQLGLRHQELPAGAGSFRNATAGLWLSVYLAKFFGIQGVFRHFFDSTPNTAGITVSGNRYEGGAFLDFRALRVFGTYVNESENAIVRSGVQVGATLFF